MMWKENYRIGVRLIDEQHMELFRMTDELLTAIREKADKKKFLKAIEFLRNYVNIHFRDEEAYQQSIGYSGFADHQKAHRDFTGTVLEMEQRMQDNDYDIRVVKELAGVLTAWLIFHVMDADQKIVGKKLQKGGEPPLSLLDAVVSSTHYVLEMMAGLASEDEWESAYQDPGTEAIFVRIKILGDQRGDVVFCFSNELAFRLIKIMTVSEAGPVDELVCSLVSELANISIGMAVTVLSKQGINCRVTPPEYSRERILIEGCQPSVKVNTQAGSLELAMNFIG